MTTENTKPESSTTDNKEERQKRIEIRQFAFNEIKKKTDSNIVILELVRRGMKEQEASELVTKLQKVDMAALQEQEEEILSTGWFKDIVIGSILLLIGIGILIASITSVLSGGGFFYVIGIIPIGIYLLSEGIFKKNIRRKKKQKRS